MPFVRREREPFARHEDPKIRQVGMWGVVMDDDRFPPDSERNAVAVLLDCGIVLRSVPVSSREWFVASDKNKDAEYATGTRDLPPANARVFVMMPSGTFDDAFILCSGFSLDNASANKPLFDKDKSYLRETQRAAGKSGFWSVKYDDTTGSFEMASPDGKTTLKLDYGENGSEKDPHEMAAALCGEISLSYKKGDSWTAAFFGGGGEPDCEITRKKGDSVEVKAFGATFKIDKDGKTDFADKSGNEIAVDGNGVKITDKSGNEVVMSQSGIKETASGSGKVSYGNSAGTLADILSGIIDVCDRLQTAGSPASHTPVPGQFEAVKAKLKQITE